MAEARSLLVAGAPADALARLDGAKDVRAPGLSARLVGGYAALLLDDPTRAREELESARRIDARSPQALVGLCVLGAAVDCDAAVAASQEVSPCPALLARAVVLAGAGEGVDAQADVDACAAQEPDHDGPARLGILLPALAVGDVGARRAALEVVLRDPGGGDADPRLEATDTAREALASEDTEAALDTLAAVEERWGKGAETDLLRAQAESQRGRKDAARTLLIGAADAVTPGSRLALTACVLAADLEAHDQAERLCGDAAKASRGEERCGALHALGLSRLNRQQWAAADGALSACLDDDPADAGVWADAALASAALGDVDAALTRLRGAHARDPEVLDVSAFDDEVAFSTFRADPRGAAALSALRGGRVP